MRTVKELTRENAKTPIAKAFLKAREKKELKELQKKNFERIQEEIKKSLKEW
jgi:hypothetical protein